MPPRNLSQDLGGEPLVFDDHSKCEECECDSAYVVTVVTVVWTNPVTKRCIFFERKEKSCGEKEGEKLTTAPNNYFHMTSRRPYWCPKTILWELNSFLMQTLSFVPINLHRCWSLEENTLFLKYIFEFLINTALPASNSVYQQNFQKLLRSD